MNFMANNAGEASDTHTYNVASLNSGNKSPRARNETVTWRQYPLDYVGEGGSCPEVLGSLLSSFGMADTAEINPDKAAGSAKLRNAKAALVSAAGWTSGFVHFKDGQALRKLVKSTMEPTYLQSSRSALPKGSHDMAASSPMQIRHDEREPHSYSSSFQSRAFTNATFGNYPVCGALDECTPRDPWSSTSLTGGNQGLQRTEPSKDQAASGSSLCESPQLIDSQGLRDNPNIERTHHVQSSSRILGAEDQSKGSSFPATSSGHCRRVCGVPSYVRFFSLSEPRLAQERMGNAPPEVVEMSCFEGSQNSAAEMSVKETNSSIGKQKAGDHDYQSKNAEVDSAEVKQLNTRPLKRSRLAESHNLSEKRRRNRINEKLKTLQELIPNSHKTDKASILDEAIEYLKTLQSQLQMMSMRCGMRLSSMAIPAGIQHSQGFQMASCHPRGIGLPLMNGSTGLGIGMGMSTMLLPQGIDRKPFPALPAIASHSSLSMLPAAAQFGSQPYPGMELSFSQQASAPDSYKQPQVVSSAEVHPHWQNLS